MVSDEEKREKKYGHRLIAITGGAALLAVAVNFAIYAISSRSKNRRKKEVRGSKVRINLSASGILKLADRIIDKSKKFGDAFSTKESPIWMDSSTTEQCKALEEAVGGPLEMSKLTEFAVVFNGQNREVMELV